MRSTYSVHDLILNYDPEHPQERSCGRLRRHKELDRPASRTRSAAGHARQPHHFHNLRRTRGNFSRFVR
jgi:hypothetical protein